MGVAEAIGTLAVELAQLENTLESQAYQAMQQGLMIGPDGGMDGYGGGHGMELAMEYNRVREQVLAEADQVRSAAAQRLYALYQQVFNVNPHPSTTDAVTAAGLLADLLAVPTASRRDVNAKLKVLKGRFLKLGEEITQAKRAGRSADEILGRISEVRGELNKVQEELANTGNTESALSKLLDTRLKDTENYLQGKAGSGRHVAGNTPEDLKAAAAADKPMWMKVLKIGNDIPVIDVGTTLLGTGIGTYYDVKGGESVGHALRDEAISNTVGTVAGTGSAAVIGAEWGGRLGRLGGPVGIAAGVVIGYGVGDLTHNLCTEQWGQDTLHHGEAKGLAVGTWHSVVATGKDFGQLGTGVGHEAEHLWDNVFD